MIMVCAGGLGCRKNIISVHLVVVVCALKDNLRCLIMAEVKSS